MTADVEDDQVNSTTQQGRLFHQCSPMGQVTIGKRHLSAGWRCQTRRWVCLYHRQGHSGHGCTMAAGASTCCSTVRSSRSQVQESNAVAVLNIVRDRH